MLFLSFSDVNVRLLKTFSALDRKQVNSVAVLRSLGCSLSPELIS